MSIYLELTREFNAGKLRAVLSSGQAVVLEEVASLPLREAHTVLLARAQGVLPFEPPGRSP